MVHEIFVQKEPSYNITLIQAREAVIVYQGYTTEKG